VQYFGFNIQLFVQTKKEKHYSIYSCELSYNSVLLIPNNFVRYINDDNLFFKENLEHYVYKRFYNLL
jgi:hypothetical protein